MDAAPAGPKTASAAVDTAAELTKSAPKQLCRLWRAPHRPCRRAAVPAITTHRKNIARSAGYSCRTIWYSKDALSTCTLSRRLPATGCEEAATTCDGGEEHRRRGSCGATARGEERCLARPSAATLLSAGDGSGAAPSQPLGGFARAHLNASGRLYATLVAANF